MEPTEEALDPGPEEDQRVERAQQRRASVLARDHLADTQIGRRAPPRDIDALELPGTDQIGQRRLHLCRSEPEVVADVAFGAHPERRGRPQAQLPHRVGLVHLPVEHRRRQHPLGELVVSGEPDPRRGCQRPRGPQRLGHPFRLAAIPPRPLAATWFGLQIGLDLARGARAQFGDGGQHFLGEPRVLLDDVGPPPTVAVLPHPPSQQGPVLHRHQRGLVRPVFDQQPRRSRRVTPGGPVQHVAIVGTESAEHRCVMGPHRYRHRVQLQHLQPRDQALEVRPGHRPPGSGLVKALRRHRHPPRLRGGQRRHARM